MSAFSHVKSDTIADFTGTITGFNSQGSTTTIAATNLVRPSDWNSAHNFFQTISGNTSGTSTASGTNLVIGGTGALTVSHSTAAGAATLWISAPTEAVISTWMRPGDGAATTMGAPINNSASFIFARMDERVTATRLDLMASVNVGTAANASTAGINYSLTGIIYTRNGDTLNTVSSSSRTAGMTWSSNNTSNVTGGLFLSMPLNVNATPGNYFFGLQLSTAATGGTLTGAATTSLGNTFSMFGVGTGGHGLFSARDINAGSANSAGPVVIGMNSSTGGLSTVSLSNVSIAGSKAQRANLWIRLLG